MLDFAQHLVTSIDLSMLNLPAIDISSNLHFNLADIHSHLNMDLLAQEFKQDMMGDVSKGWNNFVKSGQVYALIIGLIVGYLFRSLTSF